MLNELIPYVWMKAVVWSIPPGIGLLIGAVLALAPLFSRISHGVIAGIMGIGSGCLLAVVAFEMALEAKATLGEVSVCIGLIVGALVFSLVNREISKRGAKNRKRCGECVEQPSESSNPGSGAAIAIGSLLDAVPGGLMLGITIGETGMVGVATVAGFVMSNIPQTLSGSAGMAKAGRSHKFITYVWLLVFLAGTLFAVIGSLSIQVLTGHPLGWLKVMSGGLLLSMVAETMIPEAFDEAPALSGTFAAVGFAIIILLGH